MSKSKGHIVVVDDDPQMRELLEEYFLGQGYELSLFEDAHRAYESFSSGATQPEKVDLVISDIKMPKLTGTEFAEKLKLLCPDIPVVLITAFGSIESAIEAIRRGAHDYVVKPFKLGELAITADRAIEYRRLHAENRLLRDELKKNWSFDRMLGKSPAMQAIFALVKRVSGATASVLITGESGTGKELVARAIHESGPRRGKPFVAINCTAIPEHLLESELFGHAKGSFTGAIQRKTGLFDEASGGTIFLDEIGDMDLQLQSKLLRVLQEKKIRAVGENTLRDVDVRVIAATHKDIRAAIREGRFREDLYYRLSVIPVEIPALRHRKEDIPLLADHFLKKYAAENGAKIRGFTKGALKKLLEHPWEGNVRELENLVERLTILAEGELIEATDVPDPDLENADEFFGKATSSFPTIDDLEKRYVRLVLQKTGGRKDRAAQILGINRRTLYRKEQEYGFSTDALSSDSDSPPLEH